MPICIPPDLPARRTLEDENIFVMDLARAASQDIRPLRAVIVNLMPTKIATETQLLRLIGNTPLQVEAYLVQTSTYTPRHVPAGHLARFYTTFDAIKDNFYDAMIITGAPVENLEFSDVAYWDEICGMLDWARGHVFSTLHICWAAQAALYHFYGIRRRVLGEKRSGVFRSSPLVRNHPLLRGFSDTFWVPHSHYAEIGARDIEACPELTLLCASPEAGPDVAATADMRKIFVFGHFEYDTETLDKEYLRDLSAGREPKPPVNYYKDGDAASAPVNRWRGHATLFFANWINTVYQNTPYDLTKGFGPI